MTLCAGNLYRRERVKRDPGDIIDRLSIARLKVERIKESENKKEFEYFKTGLDELVEEYRNTSNNINWYSASDYIYDINSIIWRLESDLRRGNLDHDMRACGDRAVLIREVNKLRVNFKNFINNMVGEGFIDKKKDHLSE